jgi:hypothetical protein
MPDVVDPLAAQRQAQERAEADARKKRLGLTGSTVSAPAAETDLHGSLIQSVSPASQVAAQRLRASTLASKVKNQGIHSYSAPGSAKGRTSFSDEAGD